MIARATRALALAATIAIVAGCAGTSRVSRVDRGPAPGAADSRDQARVTALATDTQWRFDGRIAVSDGKDSGSGRIRWEQDGEFYLIEVRAPISNDTWRLSGDAHAAQLDGVRPQPARDRDPQALLERELGWHLPVNAVRDWVRGLPHDPATARVEYDAQGRPAKLFEQGWAVEYRGWIDGADGGQALPKRVFATRAPYQVRLAIATWNGDGGR